MLKKVTPEDLRRYLVVNPENGNANYLGDVLKGCLIYDIAEQEPEKKEEKQVQEEPKEEPKKRTRKKVNREAIEALIDAGHPIGLGAKRGYTYGSREGMNRKYYDYISRRNDMSRKILRLSRTMQKLEGQEAFDEVLVPEL